MSHSSKAITKISYWAKGMVQQVNAFAAQPNKMNSVSGSHMLEVSVCVRACARMRARLDVHVPVRRQPCRVSTLFLPFMGSRD